MVRQVRGATKVKKVTQKVLQKQPIQKQSDTSKISSRKSSRIKGSSQKIAKVIQKQKKSVQQKNSMVKKQVLAKKVKSKRSIRDVVIRPVVKKLSRRQTKSKQSNENIESKVPRPFAIYTSEQYSIYKQLTAKLNQEQILSLKEMLRFNGQTMSGVKSDLVNKVADGLLLGSIPRCIKCFGGRPKFNQTTGSYACLGYRDDEDFVWCRMSYNFDELPRKVWKVIEG